MPAGAPSHSGQIHFSAKEKDRKNSQGFFRSVSAHCHISLVCRFTGFDQAVKIGKRIFDCFAVI